MENNVKVSLIIPTHNSEKYIGQAIESARSQSLTDIEIICVDSSDKDSTPQILERNAAEDARIRIIFDDDSSYGHKINRGIDEARGQYIAVLESDDCLNKDSLKIRWDTVCKYDHQLDFLKAEHADFRGEGSSITEEKKCHYPNDVYNGKINLQERKELWNGAFNRIWDGLYKLDFLKYNNIRLNESAGASYQDTGFGVLCIMHAKEVCFIPDTVYMYRRDNEDSSIKNDKKYLMIKEEFDWLDNQLRERKLLNENNYSIYKSFKNEIFRWNVERISEEYRRKFKEAVIGQSDYEIKVSVLMPSLNVKKYIKQSIDSVINQTLKEIEIICIDAGSTDGTLDILRDYETKCRNLKVIQSEKKSYGYQMNLGLSAAKGEYIGIVETDDYIDNKMFETLYEKAKWYDADVTKGLPFDCFDYEENGFLEVPVVYRNDTLQIGKVVFPEEFPTIHAWDSNIWNGIYRRDFLKKNHIRFRETEGAAFQDIGFQQRVLNSAKDYICIPAYLYHYRKDRPGSSTVSENCVKYIYGEYKNLISAPGLKKSRYTAVYERMISAFLDELEKYLMLVDFDPERIKCMPEIEWFYDQTLNAFDRGILQPNNTDMYRWQRIKEFSKGIQEYIDDFKRRILPLKTWLEACENTCDHKKVVLFGSGNYGQKLLIFLIKNGIIPVAICDNDLNKLSCSYYGINVYTPEDVTRKFPDSAFVIASKNNYKDMIRQLVGIGVSERNMVVFNGSEEGIIEALGKRPVIYREMNR